MNNIKVRVMLYSMLSRLFTYPVDTEALKLVSSISLEEDQIRTDAIGSALAQMQSSIANSVSFSDLAEMLKCEATRLFEGPGQPAAPPFGSYYVNGHRLMEQESVAVRNAYISARLIPVQNIRLPPDHLALELGFMATLGESCKDSQKAISTSREFLAEHLLNWIPAWHSDVLSAMPHPFFAGLVTFTLALLESDLEWLDELNCINSQEVFIKR